MGEERKFCLVAVWVHPDHALLPLLDETAKEKALLINTREDWPYTFMQLCEDSWHVCLSNARHLSILVDGAPSKMPAEGHKLLQFGSKVVYLEG